MRRLLKEVELWPRVPLLGVYPKEVESGSCRNTCTPVFTAAWKTSVFKQSQDTGGGAPSEMCLSREQGVTSAYGFVARLGARLSELLPDGLLAHRAEAVTAEGVACAVGRLAREQVEWTPGHYLRGHTGAAPRPQVRGGSSCAPRVHRNTG